MGDQGLLVLIGKLAQGGGDGSALLAADRLLLRKGRLAQVDQPMRVPSAAILAGRQGPGQVSGGHDGVGGKGPRFKASARRHDPGERLLHQILHDLPVTDPGADDPPQQRSQLNDIIMLEAAGALTSTQAHHSRTRRPPSRPAVAIQGQRSSPATIGIPACVMSSPATSQLQ
jgi:hypothetical protein